MLEVQTAQIVYSEKVLTDSKIDRNEGRKRGEESRKHKDEKNGKKHLSKI